MALPPGLVVPHAGGCQGVGDQARERRRSAEDAGAAAREVWDEDLEGSNAAGAAGSRRFKRAFGAGSSAAGAAGSRRFKRAFGAGLNAAGAAGSRGFKRAFGAGSSAAGAAGLRVQR